MKIAIIGVGNMGEKVCTPGGITIKGINSLEHDGFTSAVIKAMKASTPHWKSPPTTVRLLQMQGW